MNKQEIFNRLALTICEVFTDHFKKIKNFGAYTTMHRNSVKSPKEQLQWLVNYCKRKGIDYQALYEDICCEKVEC